MAFSQLRSFASARAALRLSWKHDCNKQFVQNSPVYSKAESSDFLLREDLSCENFTGSVDNGRICQTVRFDTDSGKACSKDR